MGGYPTLIVADSQLREIGRVVGLHPGKQLGQLLVGSILGQEEGHGAANRLGRRVAVYVLSAGVPTEDGTVKGFADDGVFRRFHDRRQVGG